MSTEAPNSVFATVEEAIDEIRAGRFVVVVDDEDRENEGDLTIAAQFVTPEAVNFMATHGRGFEVSLIPETLERTNLGAAKPGGRVNQEVDVLAKYVERLVAPR